MIVDEAVRFFAEVGFEGQTRALAQRLGVTQPLLYRYFPDKEALIERVYEEVFIGGWQAEWDALIADRSRALLERIVQFYREYMRANVSYERVRLFLFAGLKDQNIANRYMAFVREHVFVPMCREIRAEAGLDGGALPSDAEIEAVAGLHGAVSYVGMRRWVFNAPVPENTDEVVACLIATFLQGAPTTFRAMAGK